MKNNDNGVIISLVGVSKSFFENGKEISILKNLNLAVHKGEKIAIVGPSGSGKSTILSLIGGLDQPSSGDVTVNGKILNSLSEKQLAKFRNEDIGIIFQSFELIVPFTVIENVSAPQDIKGENDESYVTTLLDRVGLSHKSTSGVINLSGGEKQRTAIARSLANRPQIVLADEPTGSLDRATGQTVLKLLVDIVDKEDKVLVIITHDEEVARQMDKVYFLKDKQLICN